MKTLNIYILILILGLIACIFMYTTLYSYDSFKTDIDSNIYHFYNKYNLGDNIFFSNYIYNIAPELRLRNISIKYYVQPENIKQVSEFIPDDIVTLHPLTECPENAHDEWIGLSFGNNEIPSINNNVFGFLTGHFNTLAKSLGLPTINNIIRTDPSLLELYDTLDPICKNIDVLIINAVPRSGQYRYNKDEWDDLSKYISSKYNTITTDKVPGVKCTRDYNLSVKGIAAISTHAKYIIAVNSGPIVGCYNTYTLDNMTHMYVFDISNKYKHPKITNAESVDEVKAAL